MSGGRLKRALRKPPRVLAQRLLDEAAVELERIRAPRRRAFSATDLLRASRAESLDALWDRVVSRAPFPHEGTHDPEAAADAVARRVNLLGSGPIELKRPIDWTIDYTTGKHWPSGYAPRLAYVDFADASDVKVSWEISRHQWLLPAAVAYRETTDERYAEAVRDVLDEWIAANPYAGTVNWAVTMEVALRVLTWSFLVGVLGRSDAWQDDGFRQRFLRALWLQGDYTERYLERSDVNGNHFTADAAGLVFAGLLFDHDRWADLGWGLLVQELPRQVYPDGCDFEASAAYHQLVYELFELPARYRDQLGRDVPEAYRARLAAMNDFTAAMTGPDGRLPLWGDDDDARALPLSQRSSTPRRESASFPDGGVYVLARESDHVFIDCGPVGLAGKGGHGHNDCLSFEAHLDGAKVITDSGSYVYTASAEWRNRFRATAAHNTPRVDGAEQNRIPDSLWSLEDDAQPRALSVEPYRFRGSHTGYERLSDPVTPIRTIALEPDLHALLVHDDFVGGGSHDIEIPFHLDPALEVDEHGERVGPFRLRFWGAWERSVEDSWVSPSYGVKVPSRRIVFRRTGGVAPLTVVLAPADVPVDVLESWMERMLS